MKSVPQLKNKQSKSIVNNAIEQGRGLTPGEKNTIEKLEKSSDNPDFVVDVKQKGRMYKAAQEMHKEGVEMDKEKSAMIECPECNGQFLAEAVQLFEDESGEFVVCPLCESELAIPDEDDSIMQLIGEMSEEEIDDLINDLSEDEAEILDSIMHKYQEPEIDFPEGADYEKIAEALIEGVGIGNHDPDRVADMILRSLTEEGEEEAEEDLSPEDIRCPHCGEEMTVTKDTESYEDENGGVYIVCPSCDGQIPLDVYGGDADNGEGNVETPETFDVGDASVTVNKQIKAFN